MIATTLTGFLLMAASIAVLLIQHDVNKIKHSTKEMMILAEQQLIVLKAIYAHNLKQSETETKHDEH